MITRIFARLLLILSLALPHGVSAQEIAAPDYKAWASQASAAEKQLADTGTANATLENLRDELVGWRTQFSNAQSTNSARIDTLKAQIAALGAAPAEGETEAPEIAKRRKDLTSQLEAAQAPVKSAEEAYTRANGLISEIDSELTSRQTDALMKLGSSPINPTLWPEALAAITQTGVTAWTTILDNARSETGIAKLKANAATLLLYLVIALVLVARGRYWSEQFTGFVRSRFVGVAGQGVTGFIASLSQIIAPVLGLVAISAGAQASGLLGPRGVLLFNAVTAVGLSYFISRWVVGRTLYAGGHDRPIFDLTNGQRAEMAGHAALMAVMIAVQVTLTQLADLDGYSDDTRAVLSYPLVVLTAISLYRFSLILRKASQAPTPSEGGETEDEAGPQRFTALLSNLVARLVRLVAVAVVLLGAVGYMSAAVSAVYPTVMSLALLALLTVLSRLASDVYALITRQKDDEGDGLVPVLLTFALSLAALPVLALIWGMRKERLWDIWARMREGVPVGGVDLSVSVFLTLILVFAFGLGATRLLKTALSTAVLPKTQLDKGGQNAIIAGVGYIGVFLSAIFAITSAGIDLSALAIVAGALSVGIGFGLQNIVQNFVSGIILLIERPISEGDWIEVGGQMGFVRDISVRSTRVETFDRTDVIVPNADLISNQVTNYTRGNMIGRVIVPVGVAYGTDTRKVETILKEIANAQPMVSVNPPPQVLFLNFGADALEFEIRAILRDVTFIVAVKNDINHEIARRFGEEGIEIPFAQRDIWLRNPEALTPRSRAGTVAATETTTETTTEAEIAAIEPSDFEAGDGAGEADGDST
jgi:potassium efflux system protein